MGREKSMSDCEVLIDMIQPYGVIKTVDMINGDFTFVYMDSERIMPSRDPFGINPLIYTRYEDGSIAFVSEVKALLPLGIEVNIFPSGHIFDSYINDFMCYHNGY